MAGRKGVNKMTQECPFYGAERGSIIR